MATASTKHRSLWDSDEDGAKHGNAIETAPRQRTLFSSSGSDTDNALNARNTASSMDYKRLYEEELGKRKALEVTVESLILQLADLKLALSAQPPVTTVILNDTGGSADSVIVDAQKDLLLPTDREQLAREERHRRQHKLRVMQAKQRAQGKPNGTKCDGARVASDSADGLSKNDEPAAEEVLQRPVTGGARKTQRHRLFSSDSGEDEDAVATASSVAPSPLSSTGNKTSQAAQGSGATVVDVECRPPLHVQDGLLATAAVSETATEVDPEEQKWRELAAQERQRKALARRSVRTVRRGAGSTTEAPVRARPLRGGQLRAVASSGTLHSHGGDVVVGNSGRVSAAPSGASSSVADAVGPGSRSRAARAGSGSDWDCGGDGGADEGADSGTSSGFSSSDDTGSEGPDLSSKTGSVFASVGHRALSPAEEAELDGRVRRWAAASARSLPALLCSVPDILHHSVGALKLEELHLALAPLRGARGGGTQDDTEYWAVTRMTYM
jgi:hypothetical protein